MPHNQHAPTRPNTVNDTLTPAGWLLSQFDAGAVTPLDDENCPTVRVQPMIKLKALTGGVAMFVFWADYPGTDWRWL